MTDLSDLEATARHFAGRPLNDLYEEAGLPAGPVRIVARIADETWPPRLLLALHAKRCGLPRRSLGSQEAQAELRRLGVPLMDRHLDESPLRTG